LYRYEVIDVPLGAIGGFAYGLGLGVGYSVLSEYARYGLLWAKWKALKETSRHKVAEVMQSLLNAEKDSVTGLSTKGQVDTIIEFIDKTIDFIGLVDEGIATQMFVQMIQQSIAYAINASHAGSIGTVANVYSGGASMHGTEAVNVGRNADYIDRYTRAFLSASCGLNIPTLTEALVRGANQRIEERFRSLMRSVDSLLDEWNDLALTYYRHYHSMARSRFEEALRMKETAVERAYSLLEQVANEHLARISEMLDTLEGAKQWYDAGLLTEDELNEIVLRVDLERQASENNYNELTSDILDAITSTTTEWDDKIQRALQDMSNNEDIYKTMITDAINKIFENVSLFVYQLTERISDTIEDVSAYRNISVPQVLTAPTPRLVPVMLTIKLKWYDQVIGAYKYLGGESSGVELEVWV